MYEEGKAKINAGSAFLNPEARFSRDMSMALVGQFAKRSTRILDPTAATGIRAIRYYLETRSKELTLLEINKKVSQVAKKNIKSNKVKARLLNKSIQAFANTANETFDVIDLDPFGSIAPNLYDIMKLAKGGAYLFLTATDTAVLCGAHEKACIRIYDAKPMHNELCHEIGVRILLGYAARVAAQFNYGIEVLLSVSYAHYMRLFLKLNAGADSSHASIKQLGYAYYCSKCGFRTTEKGFFPRRSACECGSLLQVSGKMWLGPLHDKERVAGIIQQFKSKAYDKKGLKMLQTIYQEADIPLYYSIPKMTKRLGIQSKSPVFVVERLRALGHAATRTHFDESSIKTDAGTSVINRILAQKR